MTSLQHLLDVTEPSGLKQEYHGNGSNAWHGPTTYTARKKGYKIKAVQSSHRYSYRWHKTKTVYYIDDEVFYHRSTFKAALRRL